MSDGFKNIPGQSSSWGDPVPSISSLPPSGNSVGDVRVTQDTGTLYEWDGSAWNATGGGGGGAPTNATYLTLSLNGTLTNERVLTPGTNISFVDTGANGTLTINAVSGGSINSFETITTPAGTSPVADSSTDVLTLTNADTNITITGNSTTDTINFSLDPTLTGITEVNTGITGTLKLKAANVIELTPSTIVGSGGLTVYNDATDNWIAGDGAGAIIFRPKPATDNGEISLFGYLTLLQQAVSPTPLSGYGGVYTKTDGNIYYRYGAGTEVQLNNNGGNIDGGYSGSVYLTAQIISGGTA